MPKFTAILFLFCVAATCARAQADSLQTIEIAGMKIDILSPKGEVKGDILVLPGWNFTRTEWCRQSELCRMARTSGYRLILPEMGKSIYATFVYPETRSDWRKLATLRWVIDTLITGLQKYQSCLLPGRKNYLLGLSTGGRGVALITQRTGRLFTAGAALSGDYDQTQQPDDNLMKGWYGTLKEHKVRWTGADNPTANAQQTAVPLYLGHGKKDKVVPWQQTQILYDALKRERPRLNVRLHLDEDAAHDWRYWGSEVTNVLAFFDIAQ